MLEVYKTLHSFFLWGREKKYVYAMLHYYCFNENTEFQKEGCYLAQCSGINEVEQFALPQSIFHR